MSRGDRPAIMLGLLGFLDRATLEAGNVLQIHTGNLADLWSISPETVRNHLKDLEAGGWIIRRNGGARVATPEGWRTAVEVDYHRRVACLYVAEWLHLYGAGWFNALPRTFDELPKQPVGDPWPILAITAP